MEARTTKLIKLTDDAPNEGKILRAAIYARYSCIGNSEYSAADQVQRTRYRNDAGMIRSRSYPEAKIEILENWVVMDEAKTGRNTDRAGYELIKSGIVSGAFDILLVDDISRLSRDMGDTLDLYETLIFHGIEAISVSDNISTADPNSKDLFVFKSYANEAQSKATSKNTMRGLEIRFINGYSVGQVPYGYYTVATRTTSVKGIEKPSHFEIKINYEKAQIIILVWTLFSEGIGCRAIASRLNERGTTPPGRGRRTATRWSEKTIWFMVNQDKYVGIWRSRTTKVVKNPATNKHVQQPRPKSEWLVAEREDLRIVPKDLEEKVKARRNKIAGERRCSQFGNAGLPFQGNTPKHLFVGTMVCGACGGNFIVVSGKDGGYLGCANANRQNVTPCSNKQLVRMSWVEWHLLDEIKKHLDSPETYQYIAKRYNELMLKKHGDVPKRLNIVNDEIAETEAAIGNYDKFIRTGNFSEHIASNLAKAEDKLKMLKSEKTYLDQQTENKVFVTPAHIKERITSLGDILGQKISEANQTMKRLLPERVVMEPVVEGKHRYYKASGAINLGAITRFYNHGNGVPTRI